LLIQVGPQLKHRNTGSTLESGDTLGIELGTAWTESENANKLS